MGGAPCWRGAAEIESRVKVSAGKPHGANGANGAVSDEVAGRQGEAI